jgi:uncharacterized membrane protein YoaK (UPF0700 family)
MHGLPPEVAQATSARLIQMTISVVAFATGCALGALLYAWVNAWCFWVPSVLVLCALLMREALADADVRR